MALSVDARNRLGIALTDFTIGDQVADAIDTSSASTIANVPAGNITATTVQGAINELDAEKAALAGATFTGPVRGTAHVLTSAANSVAVDLGLGNDFTHTTTENTTLAAPTNVGFGQTGCFVFIQGVTPMTLAFNVFWRFSNGILPSLTASAGAVDVLSYKVINANYALCAMSPDVK